MKKIIIVLILVLGFAFTATSGNDPVFKKGDKIGNIGLGFGHYGTPVELSMMWGLKNNVFEAKGLTFGAGAYLGLSFYNEQWVRNKYHHTIIVPGIRGQLDYTFIPGLEAYIGLMLGFQFWSSPNDYPGNYATGLGLGGYGGIRLFFSPRWGIYFEGGYGIAYGTIGLSYKF